MNLVQTAERLKDISDQQLMGELQNPSGMVPGYLVVSELNRRKEMRESFKAAQPPQPSVAEELAAGVQGGMMMPPRTAGPPPAPPMGNGNGGMMPRYQNGGLVRLQFPQVEEDPYDVSGYLPQSIDVPDEVSLAQVQQQLAAAFPQQNNLEGVEGELARLAAELKKRKPGKEALLQAGLAMMASRSPYFMQAAGQGGLAGLQAYRQGREGNDAAERAMLNAQAQIAAAKDIQQRAGMGAALDVFRVNQQSRTQAQHDARATENTRASLLSQAKLAKVRDQAEVMQRMIAAGMKVDDKTLEEQFTEQIKQREAAKLGVSFDTLPSDKKAAILGAARREWAAVDDNPQLKTIRDLTTQLIRNQLQPPGVGDTPISDPTQQLVQSVADRVKAGELTYTEALKTLPPRLNLAPALINAMGDDRIVPRPVRAALTDISKGQELYEQLVGLAQKIRNSKTAKERTENTVLLENSVNSLSSLFSRAIFMERGATTEGDVKRAKGLLPGWKAANFAPDYMDKELAFMRDTLGRMDKTLRVDYFKPVTAAPAQPKATTTDPLGIR